MVMDYLHIKYILMEIGKIILRGGVVGKNETLFKDVSIITNRDRNSCYFISSYS